MISTAGMSDWLDILKFTLASDDYGGFSLSAVSTVAARQLCRITVDKATTDAGISVTNEHGLTGRQFWKVAMLQQTLLYTEGDYYVKLSATSPNVSRCVILPNTLYRVLRHRHQRNMTGAIEYDSLSIELDEPATAKYRELNAVSPATLPFGQ